MKKFLVINIGSTSTKIAYCEDRTFVYNENIHHPAEEIRRCSSIRDQYGFRKKTILGFMKEHGIDSCDLDSVISRGGQTEPIEGGTYRINQAMVEQTWSGRYGNHPCNLGIRLAYDLCRESHHAVPLTADTPTTDEFEPLARYSGLKEIPRVSCFQALNQRAMARYYAEQAGRRYEDMNLVVAMLGGGISVVAHRKGRMIDGPDALEGEGPFSNNRCGSVPIGSLIKLCYSGRYDLPGMIRHINGEGGLVSYLGTMDVQQIEKNMSAGDGRSREVLEAMCYQTAKEIGAYATVLKGEVDAILLIGGMANSRFICEQIRSRVSFIAPVVVLPGEREMESLCLSAFRALTGQISIREFVPKESL